MAKDIEKQQAGGALALYDYGTDAGAGYEDQTTDDVQVPFLGIVQDLSPQHKKNKPEYIPGIEIGDLFNTATMAILPQGFPFVPVAREHVFVEWVPRDKGGGFIDRHARDSEVVAAAKKASVKFGKYSTPNGNDLQETFYLWGLGIDDNGLPFPMIIAFTSTKIAVYKKWNTARKSFVITLKDGTKQNPPMYAHQIIVKTIEQTKGGNDFFNLMLEPAAGSIAESLLAPTDKLYIAAKALYDGRESMKVDYGQGDGVTTEDDSDVAF